MHYVKSRNRNVSYRDLFLRFTRVSVLCYLNRIDLNAIREKTHAYRRGGMFCRRNRNIPASFQASDNTERVWAERRCRLGREYLSSLSRRLNISLRRGAYNIHL